MKIIAGRPRSSRGKANCDQRFSFVLCGLSVVRYKLAERDREGREGERKGGKKRKERERGDLKNLLRRKT